MCKSKKVFALLMAAIMVMSMAFAGCTPQDNNPTDAPDDTIVTTAPVEDGTEGATEAAEGEDEGSETEAAGDATDATDAVEDGVEATEGESAEGETVSGETEAPAVDATEGADAE